MAQHAESMLYGRQRYALGDEGAHRLSNAAVLVIGMGGVGAEVGA
jgi:tRNA A37 threonylcarbamoyladenosine dehydratase